MACYTMITVNLPDTDLNRRARKALGLDEKGSLSTYDAERVQVEAALLQSEDEILYLHPTAMITRDDNNGLQVSLTL